MAKAVREHVTADGFVPRCDFSRDPDDLRGVWPPVKPALFTNLTDAWRLRHDWPNRTKFMEEFGHVQLPLKTFEEKSWVRMVNYFGDFVEKPVLVQIKDFFSIVATAGTNMFLFMVSGQSDRTSERKNRRRQRKLFDDLSSSWQSPWGSNEAMLDVFAVDGIASGHGHHRHKEAWIAQVTGRKAWWVAPRAETERFSEWLKPIFPYKNLSEYEGNSPCAWLLQDGLVPTGAPIQHCVQQPGEVVVLPAAWWHKTCSIDEFNVAMGQQG